MTERLVEIPTYKDLCMLEFGPTVGKMRSHPLGYQTPNF